MLLALILSASSAAAAPIAWPDVAAPLATSADGASDSALIVGIDRYASVPRVAGATDNAKDWYAYLTRVRGVPVSSVRLLLDNEGTLEKLRKYAAEAATRVKPGGRLWFVFIGHGAPAADGKDGILVGFDAQQDPDSLYARSLPRAELLTLLGRAAGARPLVVLDACFSGRTASGAALAHGLQPLLPVAAARVTSATVLSAGGADQFAGPLPGADRPAFSFLLLGAMRGWGDADGDGKVSAREGVRYAGEALLALQSERTQTPEASGPGVDGAVASGAREKGPDLAAIVLSLRAPIEQRTVVPAASVETKPEVPSEPSAWGLEAAISFGSMPNDLMSATLADTGSATVTGCVGEAKEEGGGLGLYLGPTLRVSETVTAGAGLSLVPPFSGDSFYLVGGSLGARYQLGSAFSIGLAGGVATYRASIAPTSTCQREGVPVNIQGSNRANFTAPFTQADARWRFYGADEGLSLYLALQLGLIFGFDDAFVAETVDASIRPELIDAKLQDGLHPMIGLAFGTDLRL